MKKVFRISGIVLLCVGIVLCIYNLVIFNRVDGITPTDVVEALKNAGFSETYFEDGTVYIDSTDIYIDNGSPEIIDDSTPYKSIYIRNYSELEDTISILNAIIPLWDNSFDNYGNKIISEMNYTGSKSFKYNDIGFYLQDIYIQNKNYMNDIDDHNEYFAEEVLCVSFR